MPGQQPVSVNAGRWSGIQEQQFFDDFLTLAVSETAGAATWFLEGTSPTVAASDTILGGAAVITANATDETVMRTNGTPFQVRTRSNIFFECRFQLGDHDDAAFYCGLGTANDASPIAGLTDDIGFEKLAGVDTINYRVTAASSETDTDTGVNATSATWITVGFQLTGTTSCEFFVNGTSVGTETTLPAADVMLQPYIALSLDAGTADTATIDYILVTQSR